MHNGSKAMEASAASYAAEHKKTIKSSQDKEQDDIQRAIQMSLMETSNDVITIDDGGDNKTPPSKINSTHPCGIRNVGSSCWYNSVLQGSVFSMDEI